jgi:7-cyano-7-deazaguanine tRNA-ribosyltransferase
VFEVLDRDGLGRLGLLETRHGPVRTPALMPVVNPNKVLIPPAEMADRFGAEIVITNAYILYKSKDEGDADLHARLGFPGPIMTDSGAFQQHVYGDVDVSNREIVEYQARIGSDLVTMLDVFSEPEHTRSRASADVDETLTRAAEAAAVKAAWPGGRFALVGAVQGGVHPEERSRCAQELSKLDVDVAAIGGVVPLMESYRFRDLVKVIAASKQGLSPRLPVHLFGAGHPMVFALAALLGCDLFDSAAYAKYARAGRMMFVDGTRHASELEFTNCECPVCTQHTPQELKGDERLLAEHNLYVSFAEVRRVRQAIKAGELWELAERRCRAHPALIDGLKELRRHVEWLERFEPVSRHTALFYTGPETVYRPILYRFRQRLQGRYSPPRRRTLVMFPEDGKPYMAHYGPAMERVEALCNAHFLVKSAFGPVPIELDEMYPNSQSLVPEQIDLEVLEASEVFARHFLAGAGYEFGVLWEGDATLAELENRREDPRPLDWVMQRVRATADMQFGRGAAEALLSGHVELVRSKNTGRVRNVLVDGRHVLSMRAHDGLFTLRIEGGKVLHRAFPKPAMRVVVETETAEFNRLGKNVFAKFVVEADPELRPRDEVLVVDQEDRLAAVGQALLNPEEMVAFDRGLAVNVREGLRAS